LRNYSDHLYKMRALLKLHIIIQIIVNAIQDAQYLDFEDSLDMFQDCSIHLIQNDAEVSLKILSLEN